MYSRPSSRLSANLLRPGFSPFAPSSNRQGWPAAGVGASGHVLARPAQGGQCGACGPPPGVGTSGRRVAGGGRTRAGGTASKVALFFLYPDRIRMGSQTSCVISALILRPRPFRTDGYRACLSLPPTLSTMHSVTRDHSTTLHIRPSFRLSTDFCEEALSSSTLGSETPLATPSRPLRWVMPALITSETAPFVARYEPSLSKSYDSTEPGA
jgi:hypothetical protein